MSKYIFIFLVILSIFIGIYRDDEHHNHFTSEINSSENIKISSSFLREIIYNYISSLDVGLDMLDKSIPVIGGLKSASYERAFNKIMKHREFTNHTVEDGENLDEIIKKYNNNIDNIDDFRKVVREKNKDKVSDNYNISSGDELLIPSEK